MKKKIVKNKVELNAFNVIQKIIKLSLVEKTVPHNIYIPKWVYNFLIAEANNNTLKCVNKIKISKDSEFVTVWGSTVGYHSGMSEIFVYNPGISMLIFEFFDKKINYKGRYILL